jgi:hypothetical protein
MVEPLTLTSFLTKLRHPEKRIMRVTGFDTSEKRPPVSNGQTSGTTFVVNITL